MPREMSKKQILLTSSIVGFIAYALLTGGLAFSNNKDFGGQRNVTLTEGLRSDLWLAPKFSNWSIPLVCHYYGSSKPFGLRIQIWDISKSFTKIEIDEVIVSYEDGQTVTHTKGWSRTLKEYTRINSSSSGIIRTEMMMISDTIDDVVVRHESATITIKGLLLKNDGTNVAFSTSEDFEAESDFRVTTFWEVLAGI